MSSVLRAGDIQYFYYIKVPVCALQARPGKRACRTMVLGGGTQVSITVQFKGNVNLRIVGTT